MDIAQALGSLLAPWQALYSNSTLISTAVIATHIVALLIGGGTAIASDRAVLRAMRSGLPDQRNVRELNAAHHVVGGALVILFLSGLMLAGADIEAFIAAPLFWFKLGLVVLLCANGAFLYWTERRIAFGHDFTPALWRRLAWSARASLTLWIAVTVAGTALMNV